MSNPQEPASKDLIELIEFLGDAAVLGSIVKKDGLSLKALTDVIKAASDPKYIADAKAAFEGISTIPDDVKLFTPVDYSAVVAKLIEVSQRVKVEINKP